MGRGAVALFHEFPPLPAMQEEAAEGMARERAAGKIQRHFRGSCAQRQMRELGQACRRELERSVLEATGRELAAARTGSRLPKRYSY